CLPGVERRHGDLRLSGPFVGARHDVFRLESADEAEALGWTGPADTLFVPIVVDDSTDWLLTGSGAAAPAVAMTAGLRARAVGAGKLAQGSAVLLGIWLSGATLRPRDMRVAAESEYSTEFVGRLADHLDRFGRLKTGGAVAVVLPPPAGSNGAQLDEVIQVVQEHVRSSDVVGVVGRGAGVFIPEANGEAAASLVGRLMRGAQEKGAMAVRVGITTFRAASESPETAVHQARVNAQRDASGA